MVNLTKIYTRTGDFGDTRLADMSKTGKTDLRVAAYGSVDEANSWLGLARYADLPESVDKVLTICQNELFDVGADLATPYDPKPKWEPLRIGQESITRLETWCDEFSSQLPELKSFILPGGNMASAYLNLGRTVVRRAEREAWLAAETYGLAPEMGGVNPLAVQYLNRLSDLLFILSRFVNSGAEVLWIPGAERQPPDHKAQRNRARIRPDLQTEV